MLLHGTRRTLFRKKKNNIIIPLDPQQWLVVLRKGPVIALAEHPYCTGLDEAFTHAAVTVVNAEIGFVSQGADGGLSKD